MDKELVSADQIAHLMQKIFTDKGRFELLYPGACYKCSYKGCTTYHDYDKSCDNTKEV